MNNPSQNKKRKKKKHIKPFNIIFILILILGICLFFYLNSSHKTNNSKDYEESFINGMPYYKRLTSNTWKGNYHLDTYSTLLSNSLMRVVSYDDYLKYIDEINSNVIGKKLSNYYTNKNSNYIICSYASGFNKCNFELIDCIEENNQITIYGYQSSDEVVTTNGVGYLVVIPTNMPTDTYVNFIPCSD